jgi:hypothetical protein
VTDLDPVRRPGGFVVETDDAAGAEAAVREDEGLDNHLLVPAEPIDVLCALHC